MRATPNPAGNPWLIVLLILVAGSWAAALAFGGPAQARYQSPISPLSNLPTPTLPPTVAPSDTPVAPPAFTPAGPPAQPAAALSPTAPPLVFPSPTPTRALPEQLTATAAAARFLPPPTLTLPDAAPGGGVAAPLTAPLITPIRPTATPPAPGLTPGRLIKSGLRVLGYAWLACGTLAVIALLAAAAWLIRRRL